MGETFRLIAPNLSALIRFGGALISGNFHLLGEPLLLKLLRFRSLIDLYVFHIYNYADEGRKSICFSCKRSYFEERERREVGDKDNMQMMKNSLNFAPFKVKAFRIDSEKG